MDTGNDIGLVSLETIRHCHFVTIEMCVIDFLHNAYNSTTVVSEIVSCFGRILNAANIIE